MGASKEAIRRCANELGVDADELRRFVERGARKKARAKQRALTGGLSVKAAHVVAAVGLLELRGVKRPTRGQVEGVMRENGFAPKSSHIEILGLSYPWEEILPHRDAVPVRASESWDEYRKRAALVRYDKTRTPCRLVLTRAGRAWYRKHGGYLVRAGQRGELKHTA